jgi:cell wall-associated NlpC family hydrolase
MTSPPEQTTDTTDPTAPADNGSSPPSKRNGSNGPVPIRVPPLPGGQNATASTSPSPPGQTAPPPATPGPGGTAPATSTPPLPSTPAPAKPDTKPDANTKPDTKTDPKSQDNQDSTDDPTTALSPDSLNGLAALGPQLAAPLLNAATGIPAAALQGSGQLIPALAGAVLPQLAAMLNQLGTGPPPAGRPGRIGSAPDALTGPMSGLAGTGSASDQARTTTERLARRAAALREVEHRIGDILGLSSAKTNADRAKMQAIIDDVETALLSTSVQGDTPEAQAAVLAAMRHALDQAGDVVSSAARDKLTDAQFVGDLIKEFLAASGTDTPQAGAPGSAAAADAVTPQAGAPGSPAAADAVMAARNAVGLPYVYGGGGALGPSNGGFDCSGLTQYAIARGSGGQIILPRTTYDQINCGVPVALGELAPGDLIFSNFSAPGVPEHVQLYIGGGQVIEAPQPGEPVQIGSVPSGAQARRVL